MESDICLPNPLELGNTELYGIGGLPSSPASPPRYSLPTKKWERGNGHCHHPLKIGLLQHAAVERGSANVYQLPTLLGIALLLKKDMGAEICHLTAYLLRQLFWNTLL